MATGFPGYCGILPGSCATITQMLSPNGYATGWWGKNHNTPDTHTSSAGPFTLWPTRRGFDYISAKVSFSRSAARPSFGEEHRSDPD